MLFGFIGTYQVATQQLQLGTATVMLFMIALVIVTAGASYYLIKKDLEEANKDSEPSCYCKIDEGDRKEQHNK